MLARVNARTDLLEAERSRGLISESAYQTGRRLQFAFERMARMGSGSSFNDGDRVDAASRHEDAIAYGVDDARKLRNLMAGVEKAVGVVGARFLRRVIGDRVSYAACAAARGKSGERAVAQVAAHFRMLLEDLAEAWSARGMGSR